MKLLVPFNEQELTALEICIEARLKFLKDKVRGQYKAEKIYLTHALEVVKKKLEYYKNAVI